ncbi:MAG: hypothetical protein JW963_09685 [Anaerolineales bacterium]|nr:hypothetical protein [Anaerolineales bacterium]
MSRLDDLIDLIQTTNEVYFITAPGRVRTAYILVDDIVELALKTFLQEQALKQRDDCLTALEKARWITTDKHRSSLKRYFEEEINEDEICANLGHNSTTAPDDFKNIIAPYPMIRHWSANDPNAFVTFDNDIVEVKPFFTTPTGASNHIAITLLDEALSRHKTRNQFYHDHHQSGLTIDDDKCLTALCAMYDLIALLFPEFMSHIQQVKYKIVRCQIGVLRLKLAAHGAQDLKGPYNKALEQFEKGFQINRWSENFEHSVLHTISENFFIALRQQLREAIAQRQRKVDKINQMHSPNATRRAEAEIAQRAIVTLNQQLADIEALIN